MPRGWLRPPPGGGGGRAGGGGGGGRDPHPIPPLSKGREEIPAPPQSKPVALWTRLAMKVFETLERQRNWSEDERLVLDQVRRVADGVIAAKAAEIDRTGEFPWDNVRALNAIGANAIFVPAAYGGLGMSYRLYLAVVKIIAEACASTGIIYSTTFNGLKSLIDIGSPEQKQRFLPRIAAGGLGALAITEPAAGSDATGMKTRFTPDGDAILVEGLDILLASLNKSRPSVAAHALGIATAAFKDMVAYMNERVQSGRRIVDFQANQFLLADLATDLAMTERWLDYVASLVEGDAGEYGLEASMLKLRASDLAMRIATEAVQMHGGYGYCRDLRVERLMRDAKITQI